MDIDINSWTLTIEGESVSKPVTFSLAELKQKFTHYTYALTIECGGNGRHEFNPPAKGNQWTTGAVGCAAFTGVRLSAAAVQAIALVAEAAVVPLNNDEVLHWQCRDRLAAEQSLVVAIRSRGALYYLSEYREGVCRQPLQLYDEKPTWLEVDTVLAGQIPPWWGSGELLEVTASPEAMIELCRQEYALGKGLAPEAALPLYLEGDSPWRKTRDSES